MYSCLQVIHQIKLVSPQNLFVEGNHCEMTSLLNIGIDEMRIGNGLSSGFLFRIARRYRRRDVCINILDRSFERILKSFREKYSIDDDITVNPWKQQSCSIK
jgi:hypothetical protein